VWRLVKNETESGQNPYTGGYEEQSKDLVSRKRDLIKERSISPRPFDANCKHSHRSNDKVHVKTLNSMQSIEMAYMMQKGLKMQDIRPGQAKSQGRATKVKPTGVLSNRSRNDNMGGFGSIDKTNDSFHTD